MIKVIYSVFIARLREFYRDKGSLGWTMLFPFFLLLGFYFIFSNENPTVYKVGVLPGDASVVAEFKETKFIQWVETDDQLGSIENVARHKFDLLLKPGDPTQYWINSTSQNGYFLERILKGTIQGPVIRKTIERKEVGYVEWVIPGILAMNIMFNCLWGVGWTVVKYRQEGYLKRLYATPLRAWQFLLGQVFARYVISFFVTFVVYVGALLLVGFEMKGSYFDLILVYTAGVTCLLAVGLLIASWTTSKELADGFLNLISWPMMLMSEVWFSLEGSSESVILASKFLPLTHFVQAGRAVMIDGAGLGEIYPQLLILMVMAVVLLGVCSFVFKWSPE